MVLLSVKPLALVLPSLIIIQLSFFPFTISVRYIPSLFSQSTMVTPQTTDMASLLLILIIAALYPPIYHFQAGQKFNTNIFILKNIRIIFLAQVTRQEKKYIAIRKEKIKVSLFSEDIFYLENPGELTGKLLELIRQFIQ